MLTDLIARLRPTDSSSAAIAAAMERAKAAQAEANATVAAAEQAWSAGLLDADMGKLNELERKLAEAKTAAAAVAARVNAVVGQLETRHAAAKRSEVLATEAAARHEAEEAGHRFARWWTKNREKLAAMLREGERLNTEWNQAQYDWSDADRAARAAYPDTPQQYPAPTGNPASDWRENVREMCEPVHVPPPVIEPTPEEMDARAELERLREKSTADYRARQPYMASAGGLTVVGR